MFSFVDIEISLSFLEHSLLPTVRHAKNVKFRFFHILDLKSSTILCMALMNIPYESLFLALQDEAPPVMSFCIIAEIWLHKEDHYQKYFRERTSLVLGVKI